MGHHAGYEHNVSNSVGYASSDRECDRSAEGVADQDDAIGRRKIGNDRINAVSNAETFEASTTITMTRQIYRN